MIQRNRSSRWQGDAASQGGASDADALEAGVAGLEAQVTSTTGLTPSGASAASSASASASAAATGRDEADDARANRIAMNLARLDHAGSLAPRTPLQWKGYAWRTFDQFKTAAFGRSPSNGAFPPSNPSSALGPDSPSDAKTAAARAASGSAAAGLAHDAYDDGGKSKTESLLTGLPVSASSEALAGSWRAWAVQGVRRRSPKVISILALVVVVLGLLGALTLATVYGWAVSKEPCDVAREQLAFLKAHPRVSPNQPDFVPVLPKIVHQQWKTSKIPDGRYALWHQKFVELFPEPEYQHMIWTDENARELIKKDYPFYLDAYDGYEFNIQRADAARYFVLHKYGGLYADLDYEPLVNFWDHLPKDRVGLVESPYQYNEKLQNSLMSSPKGDPFWLETFALLEERKDKPVLQATGPMFLDALMKRAKEPFAFLPCELFQRLPLHQTAEEDASPFMSKLHREILGRIAPMKQCGDYHSNDQCHLAKHHNTASYLGDTGVLKLLWA